MTKPSAVDPPSSERAPAFTIKALATGIAAALFIVVGAWFNDMYLQQSPAIGCFLAPLPLGVLLFLVLAWNPVFGRRTSLRFHARELTVIIALMMMVSWLPVSGFFRYFQTALVTTQLQSNSNPERARLDILGHLPTSIFPGGGSAEDVAMERTLADERRILQDGALLHDLDGIGADPASYATVLDLASLVPPQMWRDADPSRARLCTERAWQRIRASDAARWDAVGDLLRSLPPDRKDAPPIWRLASSRIDAGLGKHLPTANRTYDTVYTGMYWGLAPAGRTIGLDDVPWPAWIPALVFWMPLALLMSLCVLMLSLVVHRQWSHHEQLAYPLATVTGALLRHDGDSVFGSRLFWAGALPVLGLHLLNYLAVWFPGWIPAISLHWAQAETVRSVLPSIAQAGGVNNLAFGDIYFAIIGLAFFISTEVSFSMGIAGVAAVLVGIQFYAVSGTTANLPLARSGAYLGFAAILLYTGRTYYWAVLRRAFGMAGGAAGELSEPVWAARLFLAGFAGFVIMLVGAFGLDWFIALAYGLALMLLFLVFTRIVCETGIPFLQAGWQPAQLVANILGIGAVGPAALVLIHYLGTVLSQDPRECLMPFAANAMRVAEDQGVRRLRLAMLGGGVIVLALLVGLVATTWSMYNFGSSRDRWAQMVAGINLNEATRGVATLVETGQYAASASATGLGKLAQAGGVPSGTLGWMLAGALAVVAVAVIRFRWTGFYLHPVLFLVWDTYPVQRVWLSFLIGWMIKETVVRFGGGRTYRALKPLFIGLVVGELLAVITTLISGWVYHLNTGLMPRTMGIFS